MSFAYTPECTFERYLQEALYVKDTIDMHGVQQLLQRFEHLGAAMEHATPSLFMIDYTRSQYLMMTGTTRQITGYDAREFLEGGFSMLRDIYQKDDFKVYNEKVFPANLQFLRSQPQHTHQEFIFSYNFRIRQRNGRHVSILQRGGYITSPETGLPLYSLGMVSDITPFKNDPLIYHSIEKQGVQERQLVRESYFYPEGDEGVLSQQERRVLAYIADGLSSKQIAWKLKIAENTVMNHRKNMLKKTNTKNVAELVAFACRSRII